MDLINGVLEKCPKMENKIVDENGNPIGLVEQIRRESEKNKKIEVNLEEELSKPWRKPNTDVIYCGIEFGEKFNASLNGEKNT